MVKVKDTEQDGVCQHRPALSELPSYVLWCISRDAFSMVCGT